MPFNSITGRAALSARGGHATARIWRAQGWSHQKRIANISRISRSRQALLKRVASLRVDSLQITDLPLSVLAMAYEAGRLDELLAVVSSNFKNR
jgi:hypothetical protein